MVKLEAEKQRGKGIEEEKEEGKNMGDRFWWDEPIDDMGVDELEAYVKALDELRNNVAKKASG
ncbi:hypothetical protein CCACVL1_19441 [Corchorus capsularis]|uniref:Mads box protein n=1 Tax=Corchorus capsularis TaxID=210143 RepID=A0A1R3HGY8_COCAP|nr:hypothetical protein CCACVL1_19441 [Corchorus capsularis]